MTNCCLHIFNHKLKYLIKWDKALTKWVQIASLCLFVEIPKLQNDLRNLNKSINRELARDYVNKAKGHLSLIQSGQFDKDKKTVQSQN